MESKSSLIDKDTLPKHIAIIMDGNGRWAKEKGEDRIHGHQQGVLSVRDTVEGAGELGISYLTLYAFSTENWNRPKYEVDALMELLVGTIRKEVDELKKNNVRLLVIGNIASLPTKCQEELAEGMEITAGCTGLKLILALSYSAHWEIVQAAQQIATDAISGKLTPDTINNEVFSSYLCTATYPNPELMIRTGGEHRISNFLLYQMAYTELYFTDVHWPDFRKEHLFDAILNYQQRERRFGKTSEQVKSS
jgi:undecaprenyl diphosphate synthase